MGIGKRAEIEGEGKGQRVRERERARRRYEEVQLSSCLCVWLEVLRQAVERLRRGGRMYGVLLTTDKGRQCSCSLVPSSPVQTNRKTGDGRTDQPVGSWFGYLPRWWERW
jgi:hypothetical protein